MNIKSFITFVLLAFPLLCNAQTIERSYSSHWGDTWWTFDFRTDGTFTRTPSGHYGNTPVSGQYTIKGDTIEISEVYRETHGTISRYYIMDGDSCIIDADSRYDYCVIDLTHEYISIPASRKRKITEK